MYVETDSPFSLDQIGAFIIFESPRLQISKLPNGPYIKVCLNSDSIGRHCKNMYSPEAAMEICSLLRFLVIWVSNCKTKMVRPYSL